MKYHYFYQTSKNETLDGWISAKNRYDAYKKLKREGIKPYRMLGKDPLEWKRWSAIAILSAALASSVFLYFFTRKAPPSEEPRGQLYGDPEILQQLSADGWRGTFENPGDAWFARHAIPASHCGCRDAGTENREQATDLSTERLPLPADDPPELLKMKRMVNGMKAELETFLAQGGTSAGFMERCDRRLADELDTIEDYDKAFSALHLRMEREGLSAAISKEWKQKNAELRSMGLPTIPIPH